MRLAVLLNACATISAITYEEYITDTGRQLVTKFCVGHLWDITHQHVTAECAALQMRLFRATNDSSFKTDARSNLMNLTAQFNQTRQVDFFTPYPMLYAFNALLQGAHDPALYESVMAFTYKTFQPVPVKTGAVPCNQDLQRAAGMELAARTFPGSEHATTWHQYSQSVWALVQQNGDLTEDAPNYNRIDLVYFWVLADLLNATANSSSFHHMFVRFRDQLGPSGALPNYGDSGGANNPSKGAADAANWPWDTPWAGFVAGFEHAAATFQDDSLKFAAVKSFKMGIKKQPLGSTYGDVSALMRLGFVLDWNTPMAAKPAPTSPGAAVLSRRIPELTPDKLVMRSAAAGWEDTSAFVLSDLFSARLPAAPHAHENQHAQASMT